MIGLTPRERDCLAAIRRLTRDGVPPTYDELKTALGLASRGGVHRLVHGLRARGAISMRSEAKRSIRVLDDIEGLERHTTEHLKAVRRRIDDILAGRGR